MSLHAGGRVLAFAVLVCSSSDNAASLMAEASLPTESRSLSVHPSGHLVRKQPPRMSESQDSHATSLIAANPLLVLNTTQPQVASMPTPVTDSAALTKKSKTSSPLMGGLAGVLTAIMQIVCLMWLRTALMRQYYHGGSLSESMSSLWAENGLWRFYSGVSIALVQLPLMKFGETFAQTAVTGALGMPGQGLNASSVGMIVATIAAIWRVLIVPLDSLVVNMQVHGDDAGSIFSKRVRASGLLELWSGVGALFMAQWCSKFPWWAMYNFVFQLWPNPSSSTMTLCRDGLAGISASVVSDTATNFLRILKVKRQATLEGSAGAEGYVNDAKDVMAKDGTQGLFFRGLGTRLLAGALQSAFFSMVWNRVLASMAVQ